MSAFVGLLILDGTRCPQPIVEMMLERLRHRVEARGWSARQVRGAGSMGLGYAPLFSTPEAIQDIERPDEAQTLTHNGLQLWITSDVRLDNRDELASELKLDGQEARQWSDGRLILEAYARWAQASPQHLRGDFAFAVWDAARQRLFCARDRFGTKPFYYAYKAGQFFAFANEIKALWPVPGLDASVNETQIAHYLLSRFDDKNSTFYQSVRRLSPASWMEIAPRQSGELRENLYWELDAQRELTLPRDEDYAAMLREGFFESVRQRTRSEGRFSVFLSGGLDSSAVAAVAERLAVPSQKPVPALSRVFDRFPQCDERTFIQTTLDRGEFEPIWNLSDDLTALTDIESVLWHLDQPSHGPNICGAWAQYKVLQNAGFHAVIDGHGGDEVVFMGYGRVVELMRRGKFLTARRELQALRQRGIMDVAFAPMMWNVLLRRARGTRGIGRLLKSGSRGRNRRTVHINDKANDPSARLLSPKLAAQVSELSTRSLGRTVREEHFKALNSPIQPVALEVLDAMAGAHAIESRCPFWEQHFVEVCLAFPADQKMRHGFNRYVMRRAMEGLLAPQVQWRADKTDFSPQVLESLRVVERKRIDHLLDLWNTTSGRVEEYVNLEEARALWQEVQNAPLGSLQAMPNAALLWKVLSLGLWLSQQAEKN